MSRHGDLGYQSMWLTLWANTPPVATGRHRACRVAFVGANHHRELHYAAAEWPGGMKSAPAVLINGDRYPIRWSY
jgi:hypothetical protein